MAGDLLEVPLSS